MARILLGVSGGIAAYRALELARLATRAGHGVRVLMTPTATKFVGRASFEAVVGAPALVDEFERDPARGTFPGEELPTHDPIGHLEVASRADAYLIAPASANTVAKLAGGIADSMVTTAFLACTAPRLVAPAMNERMYEDAATQENLRILRERGVHVVEPEEGELASRGERGIGRLPDPRRLLAEVEAVIPEAPRPWDGLRVLVTAGGTREPLDSVRYIGNRSSGRMGIALAEGARRLGAEVTIIAANVTAPLPAGVRAIEVETSADLADAVSAQFDRCHVLLMAAAVADFRPASTADTKIARESGGLEIHLEPTEDVLAAMARRRRDYQTLVGFAAEHGAGAVERARDKLHQKGVDAIVFNDISRADIGFDSEQNEVVVVEAEREIHLPRAPKEEIAAAILDRVEDLRHRHGHAAERR
jgi:phosphopantothenoylcysteine decarboxylase/phosphopantothenate--cysteine ligase